MPSYETRRFYGPLELSLSIPETSETRALKHPDDPSKLIREINAELLYASQEEMDNDVYMAQIVLDGLRAHGLNHVDPSYIDETSKDGELGLLAVVTKLNNGTRYDDLLSTHMSQEQIDEADQAICSMLDHTSQVMKEGGYTDAEMMHLSQFVYDNSQPEGKKMVLVDIIPLGGRKIDMEKDSMGYGFPSTLAKTVVKLSIDAINLANKTDRTITSLQKVAKLVEALPGDSLDTNDAKTALAHALNTQVITREISNLDHGRPVNLDDEDWS